MAAIVTKYAPGNQAAMIRASQMPAQSREQSERAQAMMSAAIQRRSAQANVHAGMSGALQDIIDATSSFVQSRWGQQRGTITYNPDGTITQKQAAGYPIDTAAPALYGGQTATSVQAPEGFATGLASGTTIALLMGGVIVLVLLTKKR